MKKAFEKKIFKEDYRKSKPGLHLLYVKQAVKHLVLINRATRSFQQEANINLHNAIDLLYQERQHLIDTNAAYSDAQDILDSIVSVIDYNRNQV